jgi:hypothetical protein
MANVSIVGYLNTRLGVNNTDGLEARSTPILCHVELRGLLKSLVFKLVRFTNFVNLFCKI